MLLLLPFAVAAAVCCCMLLLFATAASRAYVDVAVGAVAAVSAGREHLLITGNCCVLLVFLWLFICSYSFLCVLLLLS